MDAIENEEGIHEISLSSKTIYGKEMTFSELDKMCGVIIQIRSDSDEKEPTNELIGMLEVLLAKQESAFKKELLVEKYGMVMTKELERRVDDMCNLSEVFIERGAKEGLEKGLAQGMAQGMAQGIKALVNTLKELEQSNAYIIEKLVQEFGLSEDEARTYV